MSWFGRTRRPGPPDDQPPDVTPPERTERSAPGIAALFDGLRDDGRHTVLDLGAASEGSFEIHSRFARRIRFADLLSGPGPRSSWSGALRALPSYLDHPYDVILGWNLLDRMPPAERPLAVETLARVSVRGARLYVVGDTSGSSHSPPLRYTLLDTTRVVEEEAGPAGPAWPGLLPAEVERLLKPFTVKQAIVLRGGRREYVAFRE